jgi:hypothetical protein
VLSVAVRIAESEGALEAALPYRSNRAQETSLPNSRMSLTMFFVCGKRLLGGSVTSFGSSVLGRTSPGDVLWCNLLNRKAGHDVDFTLGINSRPTTSIPSP